MQSKLRWHELVVGDADNVIPPNGLAFHVVTAEWRECGREIAKCISEWKFRVHPKRSVECERRRRRTYDDNIIRLTKPIKTKQGYCRDGFQRFDDNSADQFFFHKQVLHQSHTYRIFRIFPFSHFFFVFWALLFLAVSKCNLICILFCCMQNVNMDLAVLYT